MSTATAPITYAPPALWALAREFLLIFFQLFGDPEKLATKHTLTAKAYRLTLKWLRAGEALMRRMLLIEAAHYDKPNNRPLLHERRKRERKPVSFHPDKPEAWRVSFRCFSSDRRFPAGRRCKRREPRRFFSAWPLAERAEAMLRVFNNPEPYAKRLARRLHALPHRARALLLRPANAPDLVGRERFAETEAPCASAILHFEPG